MNNHYPHESAMRQANPWIANHLATIAIERDGMMIAQCAGTIYIWEIYAAQ